MSGSSGGGGGKAGGERIRLVGGGSTGLCSGLFEGRCFGQSRLSAPSSQLELGSYILVTCRSWGRRYVGVPAGVAAAEQSLLVTHTSRIDRGRWHRSGNAAPNSGAQPPRVGNRHPSPDGRVSRERCLVIDASQFGLWLALASDQSGQRQ